MAQAYLRDGPLHDQVFRIERDEEGNWPRTLDCSPGGDPAAGRYLYRFTDEVPSVDGTAVMPAYQYAQELRGV
jgi:hypothetical protein